MHGQFVWYELTTPDVDAARKFYPPITGWGTQQFDKDYTMWTTGGAPFAGIFKLGPEQQAKGIPPNWMPYIEAGNVDETARKVSALGGAVVVPPSDIPGTGRFAVVRDPQGATFGLYKSNTASRAWDGTPTLGRFSWHELMTTDYKKAFDFYRQLFGWEKTGEMDMGGGNPYFMYGVKGVMYGGMFTRPPEMAGMSPFWMIYVNVRDVKKAVDIATKAGAFVKQPPMEVPGGMVAIMGDPQGAAFAVHAGGSATSTQAKPSAKKKARTASRPKAKAARTGARKKATGKKRPAAKKKKTRTARKAKAKRRSR
jgi:predicted enzyme related to lactoylglutathione lyase